jgi:Bacterial PH domain/Short C-terminal domain
MGYVESLLSDGEHIVVRERQHWLAVVVDSRYPVLLLIAAIALFVLRLDPGGTIGNGLTYLGFGLVVIGLLWIVWVLLKWHNESYMVTNRRIIKVEGLLNKHTADSSLEKINDAELDQNLFGRIFNFGDLDILTAAETEVDQFRMLNHSVDFKKEMLNQKHELEFEAMRPTVSPPLRSAPLPPPMTEALAMDAAPLAPAPPPAAPSPREMSPSEVTQTLAGLADLRDRGAISAEEYEAKKADLLGRL